jgi:hypothetical protein
MQQGETAKLIVRWHISRIYEDERFKSDRDRTVHVTLHPAAPPMGKRVAGSTLPALQLEAQEQLDWWDRDTSVEGWIEESILVEMLSTQNAVELGRLRAEPDQRGLAEDMVLVQALGGDKPWRQAVEDYDGGAADFPHLEKLARAEDGLWLDVTQPARRAARDRYRRALREAGPERRGGSHAKQR